MKWQRRYAASVDGSPRALQAPGQSPLNSVSLDRSRSHDSQRPFFRSLLELPGAAGHSEPRRQAAWPGWALLSARGSAPHATCPRARVPTPAADHEKGEPCVRSKKMVVDNQKVRFSFYRERTALV